MQSVVNKWDEFHQLIYGGASELLLVTETWLSDDVNSGLIDPLSQYTIIRKDRGTSRYGGVAALIRPSRQFDVSEIDADVSFSYLEIVCFDVFCYGSTLRFRVVYRPPYYDAKAQQYLEELKKCIANCISRKHVNLVVGDFNCPKICWKDYTSTSGDCIHSSFLSASLYFSKRGAY